MTSSSLLAIDNGPDAFNVDQMKEALLEVNTDQGTKNDRALISRPLSKKQRKSQQKKRAREAKRLQAIEKQQLRARCVDWAFQAPAQGSYFGIHSVHDIAARGESIEIENGALFSVNSSDSAIAAGWKKGQILQIKPNQRWFSSFQYRIFNKDDNSSAEAKLSLGPYLNSPYTRRIVQMNTASGVVMLDNNTFWEVSDRNALLKWQINDNVIVGDNDGWFTWGFNSIIINVATDSYLTVKQTH
jgi:hypothetical protein